MPTTKTLLLLISFASPVLASTPSEQVRIVMQADSLACPTKQLMLTALADIPANVTQTLTGDFPAVAERFLKLGAEGCIMAHAGDRGYLIGGNIKRVNGAAEPLLFVSVRLDGVPHLMWTSAAATTPISVSWGSNDAHAGTKSE